MVENTRLEVLLRHDRWIVTTSLFLMAGLSWVYLLKGAGMSMDMMDMDHVMDWSPGYAVIVFLMWWIMMIAMMVPGASPVILLYSRVIRHAQKDAPVTNIFSLSMMFVTGYLVCWAVFSLIATALQWAMEQNQWVSMKMVFTQRGLMASLLIAAGLYQLSPLKSACLKNCRSPADFIARHMQSGITGALQMGLVHGVYCVGCCWLLMLLLFVGGVMNLLWILFLTLLVLAEKLLPHGKTVSVVTGYLLIAGGTVLFLSLLS
jgi:predicted metal-binding membrane protein